MNELFLSTIFGVLQFQWTLSKIYLQWKKSHCSLCCVAKSCGSFFLPAIRDTPCLVFCSGAVYWIPFNGLNSEKPCIHFRGNSCVGNRTSPNIMLAKGEVSADLLLSPDTIHFSFSYFIVNVSVWDHFFKVFCERYKFHTEFKVLWR